MTSINSIALALALVLCDFTLIIHDSVLRSTFSAATLVYITSIALMLRELNIFPACWWYNRWRIALSVVEVLLCLIILEASVQFFWRIIQDYVHVNADSILVKINEQKLINGLVCYMCCGKSNCATIFADVLLKSLSVATLVATLYFIVK